MRLSRRARYGLVGAGLLTTWLIALTLIDSPVSYDLTMRIAQAARDALGDAAGGVVLATIVRSLEMTLFALFGATLAAPLGLVLRSRARAQLVSTGRDSLAKMRAALAKPTAGVRAWTWLPAILGVLVTSIDQFTIRHATSGVVAALATLPAAFAMTVLVKKYLKLAAAPNERPEDLVRVPANEEEIHFTAVAVTRESRALVGSFSLATLGVAAAIATVPLPTLTSQGMPFIAAYAALAAAAAYGYRRASRIAVGLDGVLVVGTSQRRFLAYRDLASADVTTFGEILLVGRDGKKLRLQLTGDAEPRFESILERIRAGITRAGDEASHSAQRFSEAASAKSLASAASGRADYRGRAVSRDDLLAIVESPASTAEARAAAAKALGRAADASEHNRLRIAADRCAEPEARATLLRIADAGHNEQAETEAHAANEASAPALKPSLTR
jgi:hypothetical protein